MLYQIAALVGCLAAVEGSSAHPRRLARYFARCPKGTVVKDGVEGSPTSLDDCTCLWGFEMSGTECVAKSEFKCPANSRLKDGFVGQPTSSDDCTCHWGFGMVGGECIQKFQCPAGNPIKPDLGRVPHSIADCSCSYTEVLYVDTCSAPKFTCPPGTIVNLENAPLEGRVPESIDDCVCQGNLVMDEGICRPSKVARNNQLAQPCGTGGYVNGGTFPDKFDKDKCDCEWGFMKNSASAGGDWTECVPGPYFLADSAYRTTTRDVEPGTWGTAFPLLTYPWPGMNNAKIYRCPKFSHSNGPYPATAFSDCECDTFCGINGAGTRKKGKSTNADPDECQCDFN